MPDIRSFFGPKGGAAPAKPSTSKKAEADAPKKRTSRKVIEDSDDDDEPVVESKKLPTRSSPRKKRDGGEIQGTVTTPSEYFASSKPKAQQPVKAEAKQQPVKAEAKQQPVKAEAKRQPAKAEAKPQASPVAAVRSSPRVKRTAPRPAPTEKQTVNKRSSMADKYNALHDDEDAFMDDDGDAGDDIFAADARSRNKRKNDDYVEEESEEEFLPKPKRLASSAKPVDDDDDDEPITKTTKGSKPSTKSSTKPRKRKTPEPGSEEDEEDEEEPSSRKKPAAKKPRAPRAKKAGEPENADIQAILDDIPTVRPPTPPSTDPGKKFDWRKAAAGGGNSGAPPNPTVGDLPIGEPDCLAGLAFVFTGQLSTIAREEAQALVKRHGGKITGAPSSKTSYVVLGDDAGPSKLAKIREHGIKTINEEGLFALIRRLPAGGGSGKGAEKVRQKRKEEEEKIKQQAAEMEQEEKRKKAEEEKARKAALARGATTASQAAQPPSAQLWTVKYAPTQASHICGNKAAVERIQKWLKGWPQAKKFDFQKRGADGMGGERAVILSGPPGIGKTTAAHLAAKLEGYDVIESNASDTRSKKLVENGVSEVMNNTSLHGFFAGDGKKIDTEKKRIVLIMDEVDGMSAGDRGGVAALAKFCKKTEVPLILICNERKLPKMKPFDFVTYDIKFQRPQVDQIRSRMMTICHREGLKLSPQVLEALIEGSNRDIRQIVNMLATIKLDQISMDFDQSKDMSKAWEKSIVLKPWDICQKLLAGGLFSPASKSTLNDKIELYFNDHEFSYLLIQENYLRTKPAVIGQYRDNKREHNLKLLELMDQAAESISDGDLVDRMIHGPQQHWSLMPTHAVFSTVRPASFVYGQLLGSNFTTWLGNNSKYGKLGRYVREIHSHMRLKASGDHNEIRQQYLPVLWTQLIQRLADEGKESVDEVIELMDSYFLTRDDFDSIKELGVGPQNEDAVSIETQTKATFTRLYNSMSHPIPFMKASAVVGSKQVAKEKPDLEEAMDDEDDADAPDANEAVDDEEDNDITKDKYIKKPKAKAAKKGPKKASKAEADDEDDDKPKSRGRKAGGAKAKSKK
ncbi:putative replication factor rfc1 c terminal domain-containing protein [Rosellinia necatrix]|uniref:Replication factor C subunit 1 n=1 Tax=Rosellinia necatrix TaxID=77044 RepID=A0A1S7UL23_ROSNE|nr:putative replication factor rfc1 c terminal domain-containing protein [Rosellinia necatrix]